MTSKTDNITLSVLMKEKMKKQKKVGHTAGSVILHDTMENWIQEAERLESRLQAIAKEVKKLPQIDEVIFEEHTKEDGSFSGKKRRAIFVELPKVLKIINHESNG